MNMAAFSVTEETDYRSLKGGQLILFLIKDHFRKNVGFLRNNFNYRENLFLDLGNKNYFNIELKADFSRETEIRMNTAHFQNIFTNNIDNFFATFFHSRKTNFCESFVLQINEGKEYIVTLAASKILKKFIITTANPIPINTAEQKKERIYNAVKQAGETGLSLTQITRKVQKLSPHARRAMLDALVTDGRITKSYVKGRGKMKTIYKVVCND